MCLLVSLVRQKGFSQKIFLLALLLINLFPGQVKAQGGYAIDFDGTDDYVSIADDPVLRPTTAMTVEAWIYPEDIAGQSVPPVLRKADASSGYTLEINHTNNEISFYVHISGVGFTASPAYSISSLNQWHHVAGTYDGSTISLYINGALIGSTSVSGGITSSLEPLVIGSESFFGGRYFDGKIDEVRIWGDARSQAEIQAYMHKELVGNEADLVGYYQMSDGSGTTVMDNTGNGNDGTFGSVPVWKTSGALAAKGRVLDFSASNDYILGNVAMGSTSSITLEGWVSFNSLAGQQNLFRLHQNANSNIRIVPFKTPGNVLSYFVYDGSGTYVVNSSYTISGTGIWNHFAFVYDAGRILIYVNGEEVADETGQGSFVTDATTNVLSIAADYTGSFPQYDSDVKVDEFRIWSDARSEAEIRANKDRALTGTESDLMAYYRFGQVADAAHTTLFDYSGNGNHGTLTNMDAAAAWEVEAPFNTWIGAEDSDWANSTNWSRGVVPTTEDVGLFSWNDSTHLPSSTNINARNFFLDAGVSISHDGNLTLTGDYYNNGTFTTSGTITFSGSTSQKLGGSPSAVTTAGTLIVNNGAGVVMEQDVITTTDLALTNGPLSIGANTLTVNGTITKGTGTLTGGSTSNIVIGGAGAATGLPAVSLNNLTLNRANGLSLIGAVRVDGTFNLTDGLLNLNNQTLTIGNSANIVGTMGASRHIVATSGILQKDFGAAGSFSFPVGDGTDYTPISLNFSGGTYTSASTDVSLRTGKHPNNTSDNHYLNRYWTVNSSGMSGFSCVVTATYADGDFTGTESELVSAKWNGSAWTELNDVNEGSNQISGTVSSFSDFTAGEPTAFPVEWLRVDAVLEGDFVRVNWSTAAEQNADFYAVERRQEGQAWASLSTVQAVGNSTQEQHYRFVDQRAPEGTLFYRLRQVDLDGQESHSPIVEIARNPKVRVYPNPVTEVLHLELPEAGWKAELYDTQGKLLRKVGSIGNQLDLHALPAGTYLLRLRGPKGAVTRYSIVKE